MRGKFLAVVVSVVLAPAGLWAQVGEEPSRGKEKERPLEKVLEDIRAGEGTQAQPETPAGQEGEPRAERPPPQAGRVERAAFTTGIVDREPLDFVDTLSSDHGRVYYFTELRDMAGQSVRHRWEFNGETMAEVRFDVGGPRWRVHSSKELDSSWLGEWTVSVIDAYDRVLRKDAFQYTRAAPGERVGEEPGMPKTPPEPAYGEPEEKLPPPREVPPAAPEE